MIDALLAILMAASLAAAITCTGIGAGLFCVLVARGFLQGGRRE